MSVASAEALVQHEKGRLERLEKLHAGDPTDTVYEVRLAQQTRDVAVAERDLLHAQEHQAKVTAAKEKKGKEWDEASARAKLRKGETKEARNSAEQGTISDIVCEVDTDTDFRISFFPQDISKRSIPTTRIRIQSPTLASSTDSPNTP